MDRTKSPYETIEHHGADFVVSLSAIAEAIIGGALGIGKSQHLRSTRQRL